MKRIAGTFMLLASLGGCMQTGQTQNKAPFSQARTTQPKKAVPSPTPSPYVGPYGEPITQGNLPSQGMSPGLRPAGYVAGSNPRPGTNLIQAGYLETETEGQPKNTADANAMPVGPEAYSENGDATGAKTGHHAKHMKAPRAPGTPFYQPNDGIVPVPFQGPAGAVAAIGALPARMPMGPMNMRTSVNFASPDGMRVTWYGPTGWNEQPLITPARYNFLQGGVYRMRLSSIANRLEKVYYPTIEIVPAQESTATYLAHSSVPVTFTDEDFEQVESGNFLVKVVYLPNPNNQDLATVVGPNELVSTRLEPGIDPIVEAQRRGTILLIVRLGNIDLNAPNSPAMDAPNPFLMQRMMPPAMPAVAPAVPAPPAPLPMGNTVPNIPETKPQPKPLPQENKTDSRGSRRPLTLPSFGDSQSKGSASVNMPEDMLTSPDTGIKQSDAQPKQPPLVVLP